MEEKNLHDDKTTINISVFHGSNKILKAEDIILPGLRKHYDFGPGFYLTESRKIAEEWIVDEETPVVNEYLLSVPGNKVLYLRDREWLQVVVGFRSKLFNAHFSSPVIHGLIANDRLVDAIEIFRQGAIGDIRLFECLKMVELGNQYLLRENTNYLKWVGSKVVKGSELQRAGFRRMQKRRDMEKRVRAIYRKQAVNELFYDDYLEKGAFHEISV